MSDKNCFCGPFGNNLTKLGHQVQQIPGRGHWAVNYTGSQSFIWQQSNKIMSPSSTNVRERGDIGLLITLVPKVLICQQSDNIRTPSSTKFQ